MRVSVFTAIGAYLGILLFNLAWSLLVVWLVCSAITSVVKSSTDNCGTVYRIESVGVSGNWLCPTGESE